MKKLIVLILVLAAGYFAYQKFIVGSLSDEQKQVQVLADGFAAAKQQMVQAERSAGMDTTGDVDGVMHAVDTFLEKLQTVREGLTEEKAIEMADKLAEEMRAFLNKK
jgi:mannose/cellobiose epimerase-like protein (N-acyl-D-glucosamine 2-epimerase family)